MKMETPDPHSPQNEATPSPTSLHLEKEVEEEEERGKDEEGDSGYSTPELPTGQQLVLNLLTTWGDQFYIGLTGLEIFTASGERASITEVGKFFYFLSIIILSFLSQISADPADINVLPEYSGDPRVVANLLDGVNHTKDDLHMWLAPFTPSQPHIITISFSSPTSLAMIRVWVSQFTSPLEWSHHLPLSLSLSSYMYLRTTTSLGSIPTVEYGTWRCGWMNSSSSEEKSEGKSLILIMGYTLMMIMMMMMMICCVLIFSRASGGILNRSGNSGEV